jgi:hypothetical protein
VILEARLFENKDEALYWALHDGLYTRIRATIKKWAEDYTIGDELPEPEIARDVLITLLSGFYGHRDELTKALHLFLAEWDKEYSVEEDDEADHDNGGE